MLRRVLGLERPSTPAVPPLVFDRQRLGRLQAWSTGAVVPPLVVLVALVVYLVAALALGGGEVAGDGTPPYEAIVGVPVFTVPAWAVIVAGTVTLVATVVMVIGSGLDQRGWLLSALRLDLGAAIASWGFGVIFGPPQAGGAGDHWVGAVGFAVSGAVVAVRLAVLAPVESSLRRADAIFVLPGLSMPPSGAPQDLFALECPPGWRAELVDGPDPIRFVADVPDELVAFELSVGPMASGAHTLGSVVRVNGSSVVRAPPHGAHEIPDGASTIGYHIAHPGRPGGVTITATITARVTARRDHRRAVVATADRIVETFRWRSSTI